MRREIHTCARALKKRCLYLAHLLGVLVDVEVDAEADAAEDEVGHDEGVGGREDGGHQVLAEHLGRGSKRSEDYEE